MKRGKRMVVPSTMAKPKRAQSPDVEKVIRAFVQAVQAVIEAKTAERVQRIMREVLR